MDMDALACLIHRIVGAVEYRCFSCVHVAVIAGVLWLGRNWFCVAQMATMLASTNEIGIDLLLMFAWPHVY